VNRTNGHCMLHGFRDIAETGQMTDVTRKYGATRRDHTRFKLVFSNCRSTLRLSCCRYYITWIIDRECVIPEFLRIINNGWHNSLKNRDGLPHSTLVLNVHNFYLYVRVHSFIKEVIASCMPRLCIVVVSMKHVNLLLSPYWFSNYNIKIAHFANIQRYIPILIAYEN